MYVLFEKLDITHLDQERRRKRDEHTLRFGPVPEVSLLRAQFVDEDSDHIKSSGVTLMGVQR